MSSVDSIGGGLLNSVSAIQDPLRRIEPTSRSGTAIFSTVLRSAGSLASTIGVGGVAALPTDLIGLLQQQMQVQAQMQVISSISNLERTQHEMNMTPIRNLRLA